MPSEDAMIVNERRKYVRLMLPRYETAPRQERGRLLSEMEQVTGMHRKSLTRLLNGPTDDQETAQHIASQELRDRDRTGDCTVWESLDYVCAEQLTPACKLQNSVAPTPLSRLSSGAA